MNTTNDTYTLAERLIHLGIAASGIAAWLTGELAEDGVQSFGFTLHAWLGFAVGGTLALRLWTGLAGREPMRFSSWSPFSATQRKQAGEDLRNLLRGRFPERPMHEGLAGLVQAFGLTLMGWMAATGIVIYALAGGPETLLWEAVEEVHEVGEGLIPLYLALHVGAVALHSLFGSPVWRRMSPLNVADSARSPKSD